MEYFNTGNCNVRNDCENNGIGCNNCVRNEKYMSDNFKFKTNYFDINIKSPCDNCGCNPKNGGSGICNCTLNLPKIT